jgi:hypothetical protein
MQEIAFWVAIMMSAFNILFILLMWRNRYSSNQTFKNKVMIIREILLVAGIGYYIHQNIVILSYDGKCKAVDIDRMYHTSVAVKKLHEENKNRFTKKQVKDIFVSL